MNGTRVANVPNSNLGRANKILVSFDGSNENPACFRNIPVAAGGKKLHDPGLGSTKPVASNDTPEGRQNNPRVELVQM